LVFFEDAATGFRAALRSRPASLRPHFSRFLVRG
jgi:hypothetical protein